MFVLKKWKIILFLLNYSLPKKKLLIKIELPIKKKRNQNNLCFIAFIFIELAVSKFLNDDLKKWL